MKEASQKSFWQTSMNIDAALGISAITGVTAGVIISLKMDKSLLVKLCGASEKLSLCAGGEWIKTAVGTFSGAALLLGVIFLMGFCALGQPGELILTAVRGIGLGICTRGVYLSEHIPLSLAAFLPHAILSTAVLIIAAREAFILSTRYLRLSLTAENRLGLRNEIRDYIIKFLIYTLLLALLSLLDAMLCRRLANI